MNLPEPGRDFDSTDHDDAKQNIFAGNGILIRS